MYSEPLGYFITFTVHGTWLHGDQRGSFQNNGRFIPPDQKLFQTNQEKLKYPAVLLSTEQREIVANTFQEECHFRQWILHVQNVRTNHVHLVITAKETKPEKVMSSLKARATRILREAGLWKPDRKLWTEHGSTIYLFNEDSFHGACHYVSECQ
jgi:REP element-mobilizing transposase RayT